MVLQVDIISALEFHLCGFGQHIAKILKLRQNSNSLMIESIQGLPKSICITDLCMVALGSSDVTKLKPAGLVKNIVRYSWWALLFIVFYFGLL